MADYLTGSEELQPCVPAPRVIVNPLPAAIARARTLLVWRLEHSPVALEALRKVLGKRP